MSWFKRWGILVVSLTLIAVLAWWFVFVDHRPEAFWEVLLYSGAVDILIGGLMIIGTSPSSNQPSLAMPHLLSRRPDTSNADNTEQMDRRILRWLEASPAIWAFVITGIVTITIGFVIRVMS